MYKIGYFTDLHARSESPEGRADDFRKTILMKLEEIGEIFIREKVDLVLFGGDLYDGPEPANALITDVQTILKKWNKRIIGVIGSHDYIGYQVRTLKRTALGIGHSAGLIEIVGGVGEFPEAIEVGNNIVITGTHHTYWFAENNDNVYKSRFNKESIQIQLVHGDLNNIAPPWEHILIQNAKTESDLVISGHYHSGWERPISKSFGDREVIFYNPGAIARLARTPKIRLPKVTIISISKSTLKGLQKNEFLIRGNLVKFTDIYLTTAVENPFKEEAEIVSVENSMQDIENLLKLITSNKVETIDFKSIVYEISKINKTPKDVVETAFEYIEKASIED